MASSSQSKGRAVKVALNMALGQAVCLMTQPSGARLPRRMAMEPLVPMGSSKLRMMSVRLISRPIFLLFSASRASQCS